MSNDQRRAQQMHEQSQRRIQQESTQQSAAIQKALQDSSIAKNPEFLSRFTGLELDTELYDWLESELGPAISSQNALGNRGEQYGFERAMLNRNMVERLITERTPGRQLRHDEELNALAQGVRGWPEGSGPESDPRYREPMSDRKRRVLRQAEVVLTAHQSLSEDAKGTDAVSAVQTENRSVQKDETEKSRLKAASEGIFG